MIFKEICVLAPGLLGASVMAAVHKRNVAERLTAWARREETRKECLAQNWCDAVFETPEEAVANADLVILCAPVDVIPQLAKRIAGSLKSEALVTDVGSTKAFICKQCEAVMPAGIRFIGSHPMAGSEKTGLAHADADLFKNRACFVTPTEHSSPEWVMKLVTFWELLDALVYETNPQEHDQIVASVSHLPHLLAAALCNQLSGAPAIRLAVAGQGLKDTTRVAGGDARLWRSIFEQNRESVLSAITEYEKHIAAFKTAIETYQFSTVEKLLDNARKCRMRF